MDDRETDVTQIRAWMRTVMDKRNWSAEHWARVAETSPTNITRFLKDSTHVPSTRTIAKLSRACGSMPEIGLKVLSPVPVEKIVPLYSAKDAVSVLLLEKAPSKTTGEKAISTMQTVSDDAFAVTVSSRRMELRGIAPQDIVTCEPVAVLKPQPGGVVLYAERDQEDFHLGVYREPYITHHSSAAPEVLAIADANIVGIVVEVRRSIPLSG